MEREDDIGLRIYQEKVQKEIPKDELRHYNQYVENYISKGVIPSEAKVLAHFSVFTEIEFEKIDSHLEIFNNISDMVWLYHYIINEEGHVVEIYLHSEDRFILTFIPEMLRSLEYLEVIFFPNNYIKEIPEWITDFKFLRVLEVSNAYGPNPEVPASIKLFVESLEQFNEFL